MPKCYWLKVSLPGLASACGIRFEAELEILRDGFGDF